MVARWAHNPKAVGSNPTPATNFFQILGASMPKLPTHDTLIQPKTIAVCTYVAGVNTWKLEDYNDEFKSLVKTLGLEIAHEMVIKLRLVDKARFFTKGKLQDLVDFCNANKVEQIILSSGLNGLQHRNLEVAANVKVIDRTDLILSIFKNSAKTAEGKLQVELAEISIERTKLYGMGKDLAQQQHGEGSRGPGETVREHFLRETSEEVLKREKRLKELAKVRDAQRKKRLKSDKPMISLVGYTNAGKSTILNGLTHADVLAENKLFATLDTTTKELFLTLDKKALISDTVGFISDLPHHLIRAFRSTLDELHYADLLLHVVDLSNHSWREHIEIVNETLKDIEVKKPTVLIFNKIDAVSEDVLEAIKNECLEKNIPALFICANEKSDLVQLKKFLENSNLFKKK